MENNQHEEVTNQENIETEKRETFLRPGEKGFTVFLMVVGLFFTYNAILMYIKSPGAASYAAVPLFVSLLVVIFTIIIFISDFKKKTYHTGNMAGMARLKNAISFMFPKDVLVIMLFILLYCIGIYFGLGFYIVTPIFLWCCMSYLMAKNYLHNILWTALSLAFIFLMFSTIFKVVLP